MPVYHFSKPIYIFNRLIIISEHVTFRVKCFRPDLNFNLSPEILVVVSVYIKKKSVLEYGHKMAVFSLMLTLVMTSCRGFIEAIVMLTSDSFFTENYSTNNRL